MTHKTIIIMTYNAETGELLTPSTPEQGGPLPLDFSVTDSGSERKYDFYTVMGIKSDGSTTCINQETVTANDCYGKGFDFILVIHAQCDYDAPWKFVTIYSIPSK